MPLIRRLKNFMHMHTNAQTHMLMLIQAQDPHKHTHLIKCERFVFEPSQLFGSISFPPQ